MPPTAQSIPSNPTSSFAAQVSLVDRLAALERGPQWVRFDDTVETEIELSVCDVADVVEQMGSSENLYCDDEDKRLDW
jgi:hypothetical protein